MTSDEFLKNLPDLPPAVRLVVTPSWDSLSRLRRFFRGDNECVLFGVHEVIVERDFYPMPDDVFKAIRERAAAINAVEKRAVVMGLDGYASLLNSEIKCHFADELRMFLDAKERNVLLLVLDKNIPELRRSFENPRYGENLRYVIIDDAPSDAVELQPAVYLVRDDLFDALPPDVKSFREFLEIYEDSPSSISEIKIAVPQTIDGLRSGVRQVLDKRDYLKFFYAFDCAGFSEIAVDWLFDKVKKSTCTNVVEIIGACFDFAGNMPRNSLRVYWRSSAAEREVLRWYFAASAPARSYLCRALGACKYEDVVENDSFVERYVIAAAEMLDEPDTAPLAEERRAALQEAGKIVFEPFMPRFIEACENANAEKAAIWFNTGTDVEKVELLRRLADGVSSDGQKAIEKAYPEVKAYLSESAVYTDAVLASYFREYRRQKITRKLNVSFFGRAFAERPPESVKYRDVAIQDFRGDEQTALLVVDAMGAEYLPMITTLARERGMKIESAQPALAKLPTATKFNHIEWPARHRLQTIKALDTICHNGAEMHVNLSPEDNLRAELDVVSDQVMNAIGAELAKFSRVLLTADHGSSRLAILAQEQGMAQTLPVPDGAEVVDWRYARASNKTAVYPPEVEGSLDGDYWVVRGYHRFSKPGRSVFETHGGAALEERLVPVVVFARGSAAHETAAVNMPESELIENDDFDL